MTAKKNYALEVVDIHKAFYGNEVLKGITFGIQRGEVLGLLGSNGAGKSTLMKIINGVYRLDRGEIRMNGETVHLKDAKSAACHGIAMVYQEFSLIPTMTVAENMFLGREILKKGLIDLQACVSRAKEAFKEFGIAVDPMEEVENLSIGNKQLVEIVKALMQKPSVLILDEPTASLTGKEIQLLFEFIRKLKKQDIAVFLISHHMQEIMDICDRAVILRNGSVEMNETIDKVSIPIMVEAMIGKKITDGYLEPKKRKKSGKTLLELKGIRWKNKVRDISFSLQEGEIVGVAGLLGSGRTEMLKCIYGLIKPDEGQVFIDGDELLYANPSKTIEKGIAFVPENRRECGIIGIHSIMYNILLPIWKRMKKGLFIEEKRSEEFARKMKESLNIKCTDIHQTVEKLSGGNQQKVVFAKSLASSPKVLLLDDPTVGIDVEAKAAIAQLIRNLADEGNAVLMVSSEMGEMERLCDRVLVIQGGRIQKVLDRDKGDLLSEQSLSRAIQEY